MDGSPANHSLEKSPSGIRGLDEIAGGGLPRGRTTLLAGGPGCGKTLLAMQFLVKGVADYGEPGVFFAFEESPEELTQNVTSLGWDLPAMQAERTLAIDYIRPEFSEMHETGDWDLDGLLIRLQSAIESVGARRVVLDTIEALFGAFANEKVLRRELRRLFRWLNDREVTALVTAERGGGEFTRHGLEEYVSDCVIALDHRVSDQISTRRLRIVKYRGSVHGNDEAPFTIDHEGFSVIPLTSLGLQHKVSEKRVSSGVVALDEMLSGSGYYRGSIVLVSGSPGSGKSSLGAAFLQAGCARGDRALLFAFEESPEQVVRNMASIGLDLETPRAEGALRIISTRQSGFGLETHLGDMHRAVETFEPNLVAIDPVSGLTGHQFEIASTLTRIIDMLKSAEITAVLTAMTSDAQLGKDIGISSLIDTWIMLAYEESAGRRERHISVVKSRGMSHSNELRPFELTDDGIVIRSASERSITPETASRRVGE